MAANTLEDLIRGDMPLARFIFGDEKKRRSGSCSKTAGRSLMSPASDLDFQIS